MKEYAKFLCVRLLKRKSNIILVLTTIMLLGIILVLNSGNQERLRESVGYLAENYDESASEYKESLLEVPIDSEEYNMYKENIQFSEDFSTRYKEIAKYYDSGNKEDFYEKYLSIKNEEMGFLKNSSTGEGLDSYLNDIFYMNYLHEHNLAYEDPAFPIFALSFITDMSRMTLPILVLICCIYILAQLFTMDYYEKMDTSNILPLGRKKKTITTILLGIGISSSIFIIVIVMTFIFSLLYTSNAGFDYPFIFKTNDVSNLQAVSVLSVFPQWFFIGILFFSSACLATYIVSKVIKDEVPLFLLMLCLIIGFAYLPKLSGLLAPIAHCLPTTYLNLANTISGSTASELGNMYINFTSAVCTLSISIVLQGIFIYLITVKRRILHR